jgi:hypothetical protein
LQLFNTDITKVDQDVAYVAMVVHVCCKLLFSMFHLFFSTYVANVFIWMLQMFSHMTASVLSGMLCMFTMVSSVFQVFFCKCFKRIFQIFRLFSNICCN